MSIETYPNASFSISILLGCLIDMVVLSIRCHIQTYISTLLTGLFPSKLCVCKAGYTMLPVTNGKQIGPMLFPKSHNGADKNVECF